MATTSDAPGPLLRGIIPPMITPLATPSQLDHDGVARQIERLIAGGVHGIFVLGTTGEGPCLSRAVQQAMIRQSCEVVGQRVPLLVGATAASLDETVLLGRFAADCGATALTFAPPFYFPLSQAELVSCFRRLAERLPLPFILYDIPSMTKQHLEIESVRRLLELEGCIGIKDSSGQMIYHHELLQLVRRRDDACVLMGPEELIADAVLAGGHGGVAGGANIHPRLFVELYEAARDRRLERLGALREQLFLLRRIYFQDSYASSLVRGVKCALELLGVCRNVMSEPFAPLPREQRQAVAAVLRQLDLLAADAAPAVDTVTVEANPA